MAPSKKEMQAATKDQTSLGNLIVREGVLTHFELQECVAEFMDLQVDQLLGQFLVSRGIISPEKLEVLLIKQDAIRNGGVEHDHVMKIIGIARKTTARCTKQADEVLAWTNGTLSEVE